MRRTSAGEPEALLVGKLPGARLKRLGDYTLSLSPPEPFDAELLMPFPLDEQSETVVVA